MKNQYFGDISDYRKYGLLRALRSTGRILVAWMLTPDDGSRDGRFRQYLTEDHRFRHHDRELFDGLKGLLPAQTTPDVSLMERSGLIPNASYYCARVPDARGERSLWRQGLLEAARNVDLVFVDPDNGIELPSKPIGRKGSSKYVAWEEIEAIWAAGCSILIYQHWARERREPFAERMISELRRRTAAVCTEALSTPHVLFLLAVQERHEQKVQDAMSSLPVSWDEQIMRMRLGEETPEADHLAA